MTNRDALIHLLAISVDVSTIERMGKAEEVAGIVSFLMSEEAAYISRQVISVNGGMY